MKRPSPSSNNVWAIVLAGGEGKRLCPLVKRWLGQEQPKQYCSFYGSKSLLEYTVERAYRIAGGDRIVTVIGKGHRAYLNHPSELSGRLLEQPTARGTGPGVLLPLTYISALDPDAKVVLLPSDHFISPEEPFLQTVDQASKLLDSNDDQLVLIGAPPEGPEPEYGWIAPDSEPCDHHPAVAWRVNQFTEKPTPDEARHCYSCGHFWNTMIVVARVQTLWSLAASLHPLALNRFEKLRSGLVAVKHGWIPATGERLLLEETYSKMPEFDFSRDILTPAATSCLIVPLSNVTWSDLGNPERLFQVLDQAECRPNLSPGLLEEVHQRN